MNALSKVLLSSFVLFPLFCRSPSIAQADGKRWDKHGKHYEGQYSGTSYWQGDRYNNSDARNNPHNGKVDSDGILSPGEIPNPLINYQYNSNDHNKFNNNNYNHRPIYPNPYGRNPYQSNGQNNGWQSYGQSNGWQNYGDKKNCDVNDQQHGYQGSGSRWPQGAGSPYYHR